MQKMQHFYQMHESRLLRPTPCLLLHILTRICVLWSEYYRIQKLHDMCELFYRFLLGHFYVSVLPQIDHNAAKKISRYHACNWTRDAVSTLRQQQAYINFANYFNSIAPMQCFWQVTDCQRTPCNLEDINFKSIIIMCQCIYWLK